MKGSISLCSLVAVLVFCTFAPLATSQTLEEWKAARQAMSEGKGCESIPYSGYQESCLRHREEVNEYCGKADDGNSQIGTPWSCASLNTKALRENIQGMSEKLESLKSDKDHVGEDHDRAEALDKQIEKLSKELEFMKKSLETDLSDIEIKMDRGKRCIDARKEVQEAFRSAKSSASSVTDGEEGQLSKELREFWESKEAGHEKAIESVKAGIQICEKCKNGDL